MLVWVVNPYGSLPGEGWRAYRTTLIADAFAAEGHQVVSWISNFEHRSKKWRSEGWEERQENENYTIRIVPSTAYQSHISLARIKHERNFAKNFRDRALASEQRPDVIILGEPALFFSGAVLDVVRRRNIPLIVDIIDLWPELFDVVLPKSIRFLGRLIFAPLYLKRLALFKSADGLMAVAEDYLKIGTDINPSVPAEVVYWGLDVDDIKRAEQTVFESAVLLALTKNPGDIWVIYAGTLGENYDIRTIIDCAAKLQVTRPEIKILMAGDGPLREFLESSISTRNISNLKYLGRLSAADLNLLYRQCDMALSSYIEGSTVSMPIKAYDYFSAGLPLINSLGRSLGNFVVGKRVGFQYTPESAVEMHDAIIYLSDNETERMAMAAAARILADEFDYRRQYAKAVNLASNVIEEFKGVDHDRK